MFPLFIQTLLIDPDEHVFIVVTCLVGWYFIVEDDIREFTQMKVDKRFQGILNMLRHCQRLRELRGGGLVRYALS